MPHPVRQPQALLLSGREHPRYAARSLTAAMGAGLVFADGRSRWLGRAGALAHRAVLQHNPFADLESALRADPGVPWVGYLSYDLGRCIERLPATAQDDRGWPLLRFHRCPGGQWERGAGFPARAAGESSEQPPSHAPRAVPEKEAVRRGPETPSFFFSASPPRPLRPRAAHEAAVARALAYIGAGDIFQVNLAQRFSADFSGEPREAFRRLMAAAPAWYGGYLEFAPENPGEPWRALASSSPELFLELLPEGRVLTRPIKGTLPAHEEAQTLEQSAKDAAELHMIVDLMRNDLGRVCRYGSVTVDEARSIESHPTVHHGVASVAGQLRPECGLADLLRATMPGGSVTGAPKVRAMEIIEELEPVRRGPYCGAFGHLRADAQGNITGTLAMTIRTLAFEWTEGKDGPRGRADFSVGGGIVADSVPAAEWQETMDKAAAMMRALG